MPRSARIASASTEVGPFAPSATRRAWIRPRVLRGHLILARGEHEDVARQLEQLGVRDVVAVRVALERARARRSSVLEHRGQVEPGLVVDAAGHVRDGDDGRAARRPARARRSRRRCRSPGRRSAGRRAASRAARTRARSPSRRRRRSPRAGRPSRRSRPACRSRSRARRSPSASSTCPSSRPSSARSWPCPARGCPPAGR